MKDQLLTLRRFRDLKNTNFYRLRACEQKMQGEQANTKVQKKTKGLNDLNLVECYKRNQEKKNKLNILHADCG